MLVEKLNWRTLKMFKCQKTYKVEYAHQLFSSYTTLCHETIHGHSGKIEISFVSNTDSNVLNPDGMVIDFGEISAYVKKHIMTKYDHALFMPKDMPQEYLDVLERYNERITITESNPTAENFAKWIYDEVNQILLQHNIPVCVDKVTFWETDTGCATYG